MSRIHATSYAIRRSHSGAVIEVDFGGRPPGSAGFFAKLAPVATLRAGIPVALGIVWLVIMVASIVSASGHERASEGTAPSVLGEMH